MSKTKHIINDLINFLMEDMTICEIIWYVNHKHKN